MTSPASTQPAPSSRRARVRRVFRGCALVGVLLGSLLIGELLARAWSPEVKVERRDKAGGLYMPFDPETKARQCGPEFCVAFEINSLGFRDRLDRQEAPGARPRVLVLGDSFTVGWGVELEQAFPYLLEEQSGLEVMACGKNGSATLWEIAQARRYLPRFKPQAVLIQCFDNDPQDDWIQRGRMGLGPDDRELGEVPDRFEAEQGLALALRQALVGSVLRRKFKLFRKLVQGEEARRWPYRRPDTCEPHEHPQLEVPNPGPSDQAFFDPSTRAEWAERLELNRSLLRQLIREIKAAGVRVGLLHIPIQQVFFAKPPWRPYADHLQAICREEGIPFFDGTQILGSHEDPFALYLSFDGHLNAQGHAWLAKALAPTLRARLLGKP